MEPLFPISAFVIAFLATYRSLGTGLGCAVAVGYFNGVVRANFLGIYSTFMFDAGLLGLYAGFAAFHPKQSQVFGSTAGQFILLLTAWPAFMTMIPINDYLVQLVALRGTIWFLPVLLIASCLDNQGLRTFTRIVACMNLIALAVALYEFEVGIEPVFPRNAVTETMYNSGDVAGYTAYRIPSTFLSAHAYGGTMLWTLPLLLDRLFSRVSQVGDRVLVGAAVLAAFSGILLCAARSPVVILVVATLVAWMCSRFSVWFTLIAFALLGGAFALANTSERLQRAATLEDTEAVASRVQGSANAQFWDLLTEYPLGAGMGSSVGTSIPFFLADRAPPQVGLENEASRIIVDQGWIGLCLWLAFIGWLLSRPPVVNFVRPWQIGRLLIYALTLASWSTAFIGTGMLSAVPGSVVMLAQMGLLIQKPVGRPIPQSAELRPSVTA